MSDKTRQYELLCRQVESLAAGETNRVGVLANVASAMKEMFPATFFWVGFYLVGEEEGHGKDSGPMLRLGPFQGPVACYTIPFGKGVCGKAWKDRASVIVPDVNAFPGHIACSSQSRSEIVVPIFGNDGTVKGVIDIDSTEYDMFDDTDRIYIEKIAKILAKELVL